MGNIILDPEFRAVNRALTTEEAEALRAKIEREGPKEPLWFGSGPLAEYLLDGFNRIAIYEETGIADYPTANAPVETRDDAINWIIDHQLSRRNLNAEERDYLLGTRYLREKAQGIKSPDGKTTAERLGEADGLSGKTVQRAADFSKAVNTIAENVGKAEAQEIRQGKSKIAKGKIAEIAKEPPAAQPEAYAKAKSSKSKAKAMSDAYEDEKKAARKQALAAHKPVAAPGPPDLAGMVRDVNAAWASDAVDAYGSNLTDGREARAARPPAGPAGQAQARLGARRAAEQEGQLAGHAMARRRERRAGGAGDLLDLQNRAMPRISWMSPPGGPPSGARRAGNGLPRAGCGRH